MYRQLYPYIMSICLRYMSHKEEAEESCHDSFLKVFKKLRSYDKSRPLVPWVARLTVHCCIDNLRQKKNDQFIIPLIDNLPGTEEKITGPEVPSRILFLLNKLPPAYRVVFNLHVFEEMTHKEIAQKLGISVGTSKSNYARAKAYFKKHIAASSQEAKKMIL